MTSRRRLLQGLALTSLAPRMVAAAVPENWTQTFEVIVVGGKRWKREAIWVIRKWCEK